MGPGVEITLEYPGAQHSNYQPWGEDMIWVSNDERSRTTIHAICVFAFLLFFSARTYSDVGQRYAPRKWLDEHLDMFTTLADS